jgi:hypothetical protein
MSLSKWIMKQYWRVGTVRALLSLALSMLVLGKYYYGYIPIISDLDLWGAILLGVFLTLLFMGFGWFYDVKAKLWNESVVVGIERYPYSFVPEFRNIASDYPTMYTLIGTLRRVFIRLKMDTTQLDRIAQYLDDYFRRQPSNRRDLLRSEEEADAFLTENPLMDSSDRIGHQKYRFGTRVKRAFQAWVLRLNYIQSFTGLGQDVLVFGAIYVAFIFPDVAENGLVPIEYLFQGILLLSLPAFIIMVFAGWFYDKKLKLWSPDLTVQIERNPYSYVPDPRTYSLTFPMFYTLMKLLNDVLKHIQIEDTEIEKIAVYVDKFLQLNVSRQQDMDVAIRTRAELGKIFEMRKEKQKNGI